MPIVPLPILIPSTLPTGLINAVELVKIASNVLGGKGGGGRGDFAQAGGSHKDKIEEVFKTLNKKIS